jgi:hypothetical protein
MKYGNGNMYKSIVEFLVIAGDFDGRILIFFLWLEMVVTFDLFNIVLSIREDSSMKSLQQDS